MRFVVSIRIFRPRLSTLLSTTNYDNNDIRCTHDTDKAKWTTRPVTITSHRKHLLYTGMNNTTTATHGDKIK